MGWEGRWEGGSGWRTHVNPWLIHVSVWPNPLQYCKVISLQLIKINGKKKKKDENFVLFGRFAEDLSPEGSFSDNSESLLQRGKGESQDI